MNGSYYPQLSEQKAIAIRGAFFMPVQHRTGRRLLAFTLSTLAMLLVATVVTSVILSSLEWVKARGAETQHGPATAAELSTGAVVSKMTPASGDANGSVECPTLFWDGRRIRSRRRLAHRKKVKRTRAEIEKERRETLERTNREIDERRDTLPASRSPNRQLHQSRRDLHREHCRGPDVASAGIRGR